MEHLLKKILLYRRRKRSLTNSPILISRSPASNASCPIACGVRTNLAVRASLVREVKVASEPEALLAVLKNPPTTSSVLGWKLDRYRNGRSALSPKQDCL